MKLVVSSLCFVVPCIIAAIKRKKRDALLTSALVCTSLANHGTSNKILRKIDVLAAHMVFSYYAAKIHRPSLKRRPVQRICTYLVPFLYYTKCPAHNNWHVLMHIIGSLGLARHFG